MKVTLPYPPSANRFWRTWRGRAVKSDEARAYMVTAAALCRAAAVVLAAGPVAVTLHVYRPRKSGDLDNRIKVTLDALRGHAFTDDDQVVELHAYRHDDKARPRVEVEVRPLATEAPANRPVKHPAR